MSDYIKREDAIKAMARGIGIPYTDFIEVAERCMDDIQNADVVEVVRCKDCKHIKEEHFNIMPDGFSCELSGLMVEPGHYCSYGERADA